MKKRRKRKPKNIRKYVSWFLLFFFGSTILTTLLYAFLPVPLTPFMVVRIFQNKEWKVDKDWVSLSKISPDLQLAVIASEDQLFLEHFGFDMQAIKKAREFNLQKSKNANFKGASTISQQTAKNVFLWPKRSWFRKGLEVYFTTLIELFWTKERILEVYLNVIEMGKGVYGAQAAAQYYFKKDAIKLNAWESAFIAAILPSPSARKLSPYSPPHYILQRQFWIVDQMRHLRGGEYGRLFEDEPEREE